MINVNDYNGVVRVHAGGMQVYVKNEWQLYVVSEFVRLFPEGEKGPIEFDCEAEWEMMGWEALMFMEEMNIKDFNSSMDSLKPLYMEGACIGYALGEEHQNSYQQMLNQIEPKKKQKKVS